MGEISSPLHDIDRHIFWSKGRELFRSFIENSRQPNFNTSVASISLSNFVGSNYGFEALSGTFKKPHKKVYYSWSGEYRKHGSCRMAISCTNVHPIVALASNIEYKRVRENMAGMVASAFATNMTSDQSKQKFIIWSMTDASNIEYKCVSAIITFIATNLIGQPNLRTILAMMGMAFSINLTFGMLRETYDFPPHWSSAMVTIIPFLPILCHLMLMPKTSLVYVLETSILGQALGCKALRCMVEQQRVKDINAIPPSTDEQKPNRSRKNQKNRNKLKPKNR